MFVHAAHLISINKINFVAFQKHALQVVLYHIELWSKWTVYVVAPHFGSGTTLF